MKHKHHIIPRHVGGTDDASNLIELSVEEHAEAHKLLWEQYGRYQDYYAWQGLAGLIGKESILKGIMNQPSMKKLLSNKAKELWNNLSEEDKIKRKNKFLEIRKLSTGSLGKNWNLSEETKRKQSKPKSKNHRENMKLNHADFSGKNNPSFGSMWITNNIESKKIKKNDIIPNGWILGRAFKLRKSKT